MIDDASQMSELSAQSESTLKKFENSFNEVAQSSRAALEQIEYIHDVSFTSLAKVDHFIYKQNGYMLLANGKQESVCLDAVKVGEHECRLGKWIDSEASKKIFGHLAAFKSVHQPHARVHQQMHQVIKLMDENWHMDEKIQEKVYQLFSEVEHASDQVLNLLDKMIKEKHTQINHQHE